MQVEFYKHALGTAESKALSEACSSLFLTTGPKTSEFEKIFAAYLGVEHAIAVTSCTDAMFLTLKCWNLGPGDEVIVPAMTFIATANAVLHTGAEVIFSDVDPHTGLLDLNQVQDILRARKAVRAVIPVHLYGQMVDMQALCSLAAHYGVKVLEDSAHCVEGRRDDIKPGQLGDAAAFSFYATKNITCGEGGAVVTRHEQLAEKLRLMRLHGMDKTAMERHHSYRHWDMVDLGYKANMNDLQASLLLPQLENIEAKWLKRQTIAHTYDHAFSKQELARPLVCDNVKHAHHLYTIWPEKDRDTVLNCLRARNVGAAVNYNPVHLTSFYRSRYGLLDGSFPVAESIGRRTISLPLYPSLDHDRLEYVIEAVEYATK